MVDDYTPLISRRVMDVLNEALRPVLSPNAKVSMHSLCGGGAQTAANQGAFQEHLILHGTWRLVKGIKYYFPKQKTKVPNITAHSLS